MQIVAKISSQAIDLSRWQTSVSRLRLKTTTDGCDDESCL